MAEQNPIFWTCPACVHVRNLNLKRMTNHCRVIDQGESPVDGATWEGHDHDLCPAFQPKEGRQAPVLVGGIHSTRSI